MESVNLDDKFCLSVFEEGQIHEEGLNLKLYPCCPVWCNYYTFSDDIVNLDEEYNNDKSIEFRKSILNGSFKYCNKNLCPIYNNSPTKRDVIYGKYGNDYQNLLKNYILTGNIDRLHIKKLHLCHDRSCNYKCPSCRKNLYILTERSNKQLYDKIKEFQNKLIKYIKLLPETQIIDIGLSGSGDPLASKLGKELIYEFNKLNFPNVYILLQTNGSLFTKKFWDSIPNLHRKLKIIVSLDAFSEETYNKIRVNGNWVQVLKNIELISELYNSGNILWARLDYVVQQQNYKEIPKFIKFAKNLNLLCYLSKIINWGTFSNEEFTKLNIFDKNHPEYEEFIKIINKDYKYNKIDWGNLNEYKK